MIPWIQKPTALTNRMIATRMIIHVSLKHSLLFCVCTSIFNIVLKFSGNLLFLLCTLVKISDDNTDTCSTIFDLACNTDGFDTLCGLLTSFDFEATFSGGSWTVFAPTDEAFTKLDDALDGGIASVSDDLLLKILQFHVVKDQVLYSDDLPCESGNNLVMALNGKESRTICKSDVPYGQKGSGNDDVVDFVTVDIDACNGVVHAIEGVLLFNLASYM